MTENSTPDPIGADAVSIRQWQNKLDMEAVEVNFTHHAPDPEKNQIARYEFLRLKTKHLARHFVSECPPSRERTLALTKLEEAVMWANAAIARNE